MSHTKPKKYFGYRHLRAVAVTGFLVVAIGVGVLVSMPASPPWDQDKPPQTAGRGDNNQPGKQLHQSPKNTDAANQQPKTDPTVLLPPQAPPKAAEEPKQKPADITLVQFADSAAKQAFAEDNGLRQSDLQQIPLTDVYKVSRPAKDLAATPGATTQPNKAYHALLTPNDPLYPQWFSARISLPAAWDMSTGSSNTTIAFIDTGFALGHQDLTGRWDQNPGEAGSLATNGIDDDANSLVDDWRGWDFLHADNNPNAGSTNPTGASVSHGTAVAGMAGAIGNNGLGSSGVDWHAKLLPLQVLSDDGLGYTIDIIAALAYARTQGADVVNLSLGTTSSDTFLQQEINETIEAGVVVVAAAGNDGCDCLSYPARYPGVVAVGASDSEDNRAYFSNYGANLDVLAPGDGSIRTTLWSQANQTSLYTSMASGTSVAAPLVSGMAGLFRHQNPDASVADVVANITRGATRIPAMGQNSFTNQHGFGLMNAQATTRLATIVHPDGTLIINKNNNTIYLLQAGTKRKIPNPAIFLSHYPNTNYLVKRATLADIALPDGPIVNYRAGTLVKASAAGMYVLSYNGSTLQRRLIPSIQDFLQLGYQDAPLVTISDAQMNAIPKSANLVATSRHPDGTLVRQEGAPGVFLMEGGQRRSIPSPAVLRSLHKGNSVVLRATAADMALPRAAASQNVPFDEGAVVRGSTTAHYFIDHADGNVAKRHIASTFIFNLLELAPQEVITATDAQLPVGNGAGVQ